MPEVILACLSTESARAVAAEFEMRGGKANTVRQDGANLAISYYDKMYPLDVASWAFFNEHAGDAEAAGVIARL